MKDKWINFLGTLGIGCFASIILILLTGWLVMLLWNWLMPNIFNGVNEIDIWEAYGLTILSNLLFKTKVSVNKNA